MSIMGMAMKSPDFESVSYLVSLSILRMLSRVKVQPSGPTEEVISGLWLDEEETLIISTVLCTSW